MRKRLHPNHAGWSGRAQCRRSPLPCLLHQGRRLCTKSACARWCCV